MSCEKSRVRSRICFIIKTVIIKECFNLVAVHAGWVGCAFCYRLSYVQMEPSVCVEAVQILQSCQALAVSCWKFCRESGRTVKLFCSSARGIAVNLLQHKSDSGFLSTGNLILSCFQLFPWKALCEPLGCRGLALQLMVGKQKSCGWPQDTSLFYGSLCTLQPDVFVLHSSSVRWGGSYFLWSAQAVSWGKSCKDFFFSPRTSNSSIENSVRASFRYEGQQELS